MLVDPNSRNTLTTGMLRPVSVLVLDLVGFSRRSKTERRVIHADLERMLAETLATLGLRQTHVNHTGDGYVVCLFGDDSARMLDYLIATFPTLQRRLSLDRGQTFRAGLDFGLLELSPDRLTNRAEHFELPGIQAARLEAAAEAGQTLCTATFREVFHPHYPQAFGGTARLIKTKDRRIMAYPVEPLSSERLQNALLGALFPLGPATMPLAAVKRRILVAEDEPSMASLLKEIIITRWPGYECVVAASGVEAIRCLEAEGYDLLITDIMMPYMNGIELIRAVRQSNMSLPIIVITGYATLELATACMAAGSDDFFTKPFDVEFLEAVSRLLSDQARTELRVLFDSAEEAAAAYRVCQDVRRLLTGLYAMVGSTADAVHTLIRHKAKQLILDAVKRAHSPTTCRESLEIAVKQLESLSRLADRIGRLGGQSPVAYVQSVAKDIEVLNPRVRVEVTLPDIPSYSDLDAAGSLVTLILCELIDNAVHSVAGTGYIHVRGTVLRSKGVVRIVVSDTGGGVPQGMEEAIFDEGVTTKGPGRGFGLFLIRRSLERLGGSLRLLSGEKGKTEFEVLLPMDRAIRVGGG